MERRSQNCELLLLLWGGRLVWDMVVQCLISHSKFSSRCGIQYVPSDQTKVNHLLTLKTLIIDPVVPFKMYFDFIDSLPGWDPVALHVCAISSIPQVFEQILFLFFSCCGWTRNATRPPSPSRRRWSWRCFRSASYSRSVSRGTTLVMPTIERRFRKNFWVAFWEHS